MATRYVEEAKGSLSPIYGAANANVGEQQVGVEELYGMLAAGLTDRAALGLEDIVSSAGRRGLSERSSIGRQAASTLNDAAAFGAAQLDSERARLNADLSKAITESNVGLARESVDTGGTIQEADIARQEYELERQLQDRKQAMAIQAAERQSEVAKTAYSAQQARAAAQQAAQAGTTQGGGAYAEYKNGKDGSAGFNFYDANGNPVSAAGYAAATGQPLGTVLQQMGSAGDSYAAQVYNQLKTAAPMAAKDPNLQSSLKKSYAPIFWGT